MFGALHAPLDYSPRPDVAWGGEEIQMLRPADIDFQWRVARWAPRPPTGRGHCAGLLFASLTREADPCAGRLGGPPR